MRLIRNQDDLDQGLQALVQADPRLVPIAAAAGPVPLRLMEPGFAGLSFVIVSQMISKASAAAIWSRMSAAGPVTAQAWLACPPKTMATFGLSRAKVATLTRVAEAVSASELDLEAICRLDAVSAIRQLTALPGIGPWSAEVYLLVCGGHSDIFPSGDVALQASLAKALTLAVRPTPSVAAAIATPWAPWRSVAARLFWAYYSVTLRREIAPLASPPSAPNC
jgi:DNA-3-methyladenine glycosylase II